MAVAITVFMYFNKPANKGGVMVLSPTPTPVASITKKPAVKPPISGSAKQTQTYTELVAAYFDKRIQFDDHCQAFPPNTTFKNGTAVMFDNRSSATRSIKIGDVAYTFGGYDYKIITLLTSNFTKSWPLVCNSSSVGTLLIQK